MLGEPTNKQLRILSLIGICLSLSIIALMFFGPKTIVLEADTSGTILSGEMKQHLPRVKRESVNEDEHEEVADEGALSA